MRDSNIVGPRDLSLSPFGNEERGVRRPSLVLNRVDPLMALVESVNGYQ